MAAFGMVGGIMEMVILVHIVFSRTQVVFTTESSHSGWFIRLILQSGIKYYFVNRNGYILNVRHPPK